MLVIVIRKFDQISIENTVAAHYKSMGKFFIAQGRVTLKRMIRPAPNSNLSEILCLS